MLNGALMRTLSIHEYPIIHLPLILSQFTKVNGILTEEPDSILMPILRDQTVGNLHPGHTNINPRHGPTLHNIPRIHQLIARSTTQLQYIEIVLDAECLDGPATAHVHPVQYSLCVEFALVDAVGAWD